MQIIEKIHMDLLTRSVPPVVDVVQNDENTRGVEIYLTCGGVPWIVPEGVTAAVAFRKDADGKSGLYDQLPDDSSALTISDSTVRIIFAPEIMATAGKVNIAVVFLDADLNRLATFPMVVRVAADPSAGQGVSNNYYKFSTLESINNAINAWLEAAPQYVEAAEAAATKSQEAANEADLLVQQAVSAYNGKVDDGYVENGYLYLTSGGVVVVGPLGPFLGDGGSGGGGSVLKIQNLSEALVFAVVAGQPAVVKYTWSSVDDTGTSTGSGTVQYIVNGIVKSTLVQVPQGEVSGDMSAWLESGVNSVQVKVTDSYGSSRILTYSIQSASLSVSATFDYTVPVSGALDFRFVASGSAEKTVHFELDGIELEPMTVATSGKTSSYTVPAQSHGAHILQVWASAVVDGLNVKSNVLRYAVMWKEEGNTSPIIASAFNQTEADEGDVLVIPWVAYDPAGETASITLKEGTTVISNLSVGRTEQTWSVKANNPGDAVFSITCRDTVLAFPVTVNELDIDISVAQTDLMLELTASGRSNAETTGRDQWVSGDVAAVLSGFNFKSNGWVTDESGNTLLRVDSGASVQIPYKAFATDARSTGRTIEIDLATRAVQSSGSTVISCLQDNVGFTVSDQSAMMRSEAVSTSILFKEEKKLHVTFVIEPSNQDRFIYVYINGILSGFTQYGTDDNIQQGTPVDITIGSDVCGVDIYAIRIYDTCLTTREVLENYMSGLPTDEKRKKYMDNNILNDAEDVAYKAVMERLPVMIVTGELPPTKGEKKIVSVSYINRVDSTKNFTYDGVTIDVQGTSSQGYPKKNYKIKLPEKYEHITGHIPEKTFTLKTDYMESAGKHNTQAANLINGLYSESTPPQQEDARVRTTIAGFPFVLFHASAEGETPVFIGKYNFNNDKGNSDTLGLTNMDLHQRWEVCNNISDRCMFLDPDFSHGDITTDFEASYPDPDDKEPDYTALQELAQWIYDTKDDPDRFLAEVEDHFNLHYLLVYAVVSEFLGAMDSRTKNMFLQTWDRKIWYPVFYDIDTILGLNNEGHNVFGYDMEWQDGVWNGSKNALWNSVENVLADKMGETYRELRSSGKLTYEKLLDAFDGEAAHVSETLYNEDAEFKYVGPMMESGTDYMYAAQGSRESHRERWLYNRFKYMDSKYDAGDFKDDLATMRLYTEDGAVEASGNFDITMFADGYASVMYGANGTQVKARGAAGETVEIVAPDMTFSDTETFIYGASRISSLGDLSGKYADTVDVSKAVRLKELILGSGVSGYENPNLKKLTLTNNTLLEKVDVRGCSALAVPLGLSGCSNIRYVYAQNSAITSVALPVGGRLEEMYLPATITGLTVRDHPSLHTLEIAGYDNLGTIRLENCGTIDTLTIVKNSPNVTRLRVLDVNWTGVTAADLNRLLDVDGLDEAGNNTTMSVITGTCLVDSCSDSQLKAWKAAWPNLNVTINNLMAEYTVQFVNDDGTVLDTQVVPYKGDAVEPIAAGRISTPVKMGDAQYSYAFNSWYGSYTSVTENRVITATYVQSVNTYTVRLFNGDTQLYSTTAEYGSTVVYDGAFPVYGGTEDGDWIFAGWSEDITFIVGETNAYALFEKLEVPAEVMTLEEMSWAQILAVARAGAVDDDGDWAIDGTKWLAVGDEKNIVLSDGEELTFQIWDFNHDELSSGAGMAPITFGMKHLMAERLQMGPTHTSVGGWPASTLRTELNQTVYNKMPAALQITICAVLKHTKAYYADTDATITADRLFVPSTVEISGASPGTEGARYPAITTASKRLLSNGTGDSSHWWSRSLSISDTSYMGVGYGNVSVGSESGVCFGFCIA